MKKVVLWLLCVVVVTIALALAWMASHPASNLKSPGSRCIANLWMIETAKRRWMEDYNKTVNDTPTWDDLKPYWSLDAKKWGWENGIPVCPDGGTYILG